MRGPSQNASSSDPMPAEPTHHQAEIPSVYASPEAPISEPAPMFAARTVEKTRPGPSLRSATKKLPLPSTRRETRKPSATNATE